MTFGLGYFQDGVWVDHLAADDAALQGSADGPVAQHDPAAIDAVHQWFSCCADPVERELTVVDGESTIPPIAGTLMAAAGAAER